MSPPGEGEDRAGDLEEDEKDILEVVLALTDFTGLGENQLSFNNGDTIDVLRKTNDDWWWARLDGCHGYIPVNHVTSPANRPVGALWQDEEYFDSYGALKLQQEMLADQPRTLAYKMAIKQNADWIGGKRVLDVGCGTAVLSLFCAKLGHAAKVYAVEGSAMAEMAQKLVDHNGVAEVVEVINERLENITLPDRVDLIISEWMGTALLFEFMIESVILARDRWLSPGGVIWPSVARLHLVPCSADKLYKDKVEFWGARYDLDFSPLREAAVEEYFDRPLHNHTMSGEDALAEPQVVLELTMATVTLDNIEVIRQPFRFKVTRHGLLHGFCSWFSVDFGDLPNTTHPIVSLTTGPHQALTHWKQPLFMMDKPTEVKTGDVVMGTIQMVRNAEWRRHLHVTLIYQIDSNGQTKNFSKRFFLWR